MVTASAVAAASCVPLPHRRGGARRARRRRRRPASASRRPPRATGARCSGAAVRPRGADRADSARVGADRAAGGAAARHLSRRAAPVRGVA